MRHFFLLSIFVCIHITLGFEFFDEAFEFFSRTKRDTGVETCEACKVTFNTERVEAKTERERCKALKNYITCRTNTSTSWPGCKLTYIDGESLRSYRYAINSNCEVSDTCKCQRNRWENTNDYYKSKTYMEYMTCVYEASMPACDGVTSPKTLIDLAKKYRADALKNKTTCDERYQNSMSYNPDSETICRHLREYLSCLGEVAVGNNGFPLNTTEKENLQAVLDGSDYCEISMTDTCQCQKAYMMDNNTDTCTAARQFVSCTNNSYMNGCDNEQVSAIRALAKLLKRQNCMNDPEYICGGAEMCHIDMDGLSRDTPAIQDSSCSSVKNYISCIRNVMPPTCTATNKTVEHLESVTSGNLWCPMDYNGATSTPYYTTSPGYTSSYYTSSYYTTSSDTSSGSSTSYPYYTTAYPSTTSTNNTAGGLSSEKTMLLLSYIQSAKLEAEETLHAAEEAVEAIKTAENLVQG